MPQVVESRKYWSNKTQRYFQQCPQNTLLSQKMQNLITAFSSEQAFSEVKVSGTPRANTTCTTLRSSLQQEL